MKSFLFEFKEGLRIALYAIRANKVRSILTTLGIVIGVSSVVLMSTAIKGIDKSFEKGISALGSDVLYIDKWAWFDNTEWWKIRRRKNITIQDYEKFAEIVKLPTALSPTIWASEKVKYEDRVVESVFLEGCEASFLATTNFTFDEGRFFTDTEGKGARYVAVIGYEVAQNLFPRGGGVERFVKIGGIDYKVVGILAEQGSFMLGDFNPDKRVYVPIGTIFKHFTNSNFRSITISVKANGTGNVQAVKEEAEGAMRKIRGLTHLQENDFSINQQEGLMANYNSTVGVIQIAGFFITGLSLFVGAIGIMNIMFVSVRERTKEIGVRKAIGAKRRAILIQFLLESSLICLLGGFVGLIIAVLLSMAVNQILPTSVQADAVVIAISISLITGVVAGWAPAYKAAKKDPVDALRYE